jgi:hypothetical protein
MELGPGSGEQARVSAGTKILLTARMMRGSLPAFARGG